MGRLRQKEATKREGFLKHAEVSQKTDMRASSLAQASIHHAAAAKSMSSNY